MRFYVQKDNEIKNIQRVLRKIKKRLEILSKMRYNVFV